MEGCDPAAVVQGFGAGAANLSSAAAVIYLVKII